MTSYLPSLLTSTTHHYATQLRRTLLPGSDDGNDGDTEADSHICRVLRAYYIEKGRSFPAWLPPDPKNPRAEYSRQQSSSSSQVGANYGDMGNQRPAARRGGGLSDLWDSPGQGRGSQQSTSLRSRRDLGSSSTQSLPPPMHATNNGPVAGRGERFASGGAATERLQPVGGRPLPSQRQGSYQSTQRDQMNRSSESYTTPAQASHRADLRPQLQHASSSAASGRAQDRLKARLMGSGAPSGRTSPGGR